MKEIKHPETEERARKIRLLMLDVDGVLTDGIISISSGGGEIKSFHVRDGYGIRCLMKSGIQVAFISGRKSGVVEHRARELGIEMVFQGVRDKATVCREIAARTALRKSEIACIGDDLPDLPMFASSGVRVAVADAAGEVLEMADAVTDKRGGHGAVREVCEWILKLQGKWPWAIGQSTGK
jgi:3-deoxy-D-manno-octulosonate 8-phosphate phosphatase (KDO 8-P phosphatase)